MANGFKIGIQYGRVNDVRSYVDAGDKVSVERCAKAKSESMQNLCLLRTGPI
jgi:hypothetical protein